VRRLRLSDDGILNGWKSVALISLICAVVRRQTSAVEQYWVRDQISCATLSSNRTIS
jgi:hypothetical protein